MDAVTLPPELEQFAAEAVASGQFQSVDEVVRTGLELLRRREEARTAPLASVLAAPEESDRVGYLTADEVAAHVRETIARRSGAAA